VSAATARGSDRLKVLVLSTVFPNPAQPVHGLFVRERIRHAAAHCDIEVVAPVTWFREGVRKIPATHTADGLAVHHPKFFYLPGLLKWLDGFFLFLSVITCIRRLRRTFDFDVIDAHFAFPEGFAAVLLGKCFARSVVVTLRGAEITLLTFKLRTRLMAWSLPRANRVIAVSNQLAEIALSLGVDRERIEVIGNGVDVSRFNIVGRELARRQLRLPESGYLLVTIGRLVPGKGFHRIVRALPTLPDRLGKVGLAIVGGAAADSAGYPQQLRDLIKRLELDDRTLITGPRPHDEIAMWLNAADALVLASDREGSPNVVWEALACGRPVIATKVGAVEQILPSFAGVVVECSNDPQLLGGAITAALTRPWQSTAIRAYAERHTWHRVADHVVLCWQRAADDDVRRLCQRSAGRRFAD